MFILCAACSQACAVEGAVRDKVVQLGKEAGVPSTITLALMHEESNGNPRAKSREVGGYRSVGLFQLYTKPTNLNELLNKFWYAYDEDEAAEFDIYNPEHNAKVALRYLAALHRQFGGWYEALCFYNHGDTEHVPEGTKAYALRIVNSKEE